MTREMTDIVYEPNKAKISRRQFLQGLGLVGSAGFAAWAAQACGFVRLPDVGATKTPGPGPAFTPTPGRENSTQVPNSEATKVAPTSAETTNFGEADVLSLEVLKNTEPNAGQILDSVYTQLFAGIENKPEFDGMTFEPFIVTVESQDKKQNFLFPFFAALNEQTGNPQAILKVDITQDSDGQTKAAYNVLIPAEVPSATGSTTYTALLYGESPIFSVPFSQDELRSMTDSQRRNLEVLFTPFGFTDPTKDARISGSKLASVVAVATPVVSSTPTPEATQEPTQEPTPEPTEAPRLVEMDRVMMEFDGRQVPFTLNTVEGESDMRPLWEQEVGITKPIINPELTDKAGKFGRLLQASLWAVSEAGYSRIPYVDFINRPSDFKINIGVAGAQYRTGDFTVGEVNAVRFNLVAEGDWRFPKDSNIITAHFFDNTTGVLDLYRAVPSLSAFGPEAAKPYLQYSGHGLEEEIGEFLCPLLSTIIGMRQGNLSPNDFLALLNEVKTIAEYPKTGPASPPGETLNQYFSRLKRYGFWSVER